ncbi:hypothetical protein A8L34_18235 [Bacillus sp. FJAT-27264]|nr:hypothetical protein A8L34_18235 [Bacillus sp. FJAT-27264]
MVTPQPSPTTPPVIGTIVVDRDPVPAGPVSTATPTSTPTPTPTLDNEEIIIEDEQVPLAPVPTSTPTPSKKPATPSIVLANNSVPLSGPAVDQLPKTGESSPLPYYVTGLGLAALGLLVRFRFSRKNKS